uniref:Cyclin N-terminal domain-containing protein n=1 Tax=Chromera velia CCMP2878 TaxID=1169474 RepID=A0A0G4I2G7_9ALVE|eukprot:Cvel_10394.t1-p1 / transcript=Cvel_10394.t1 / gene=Cvel_10394 / organism=Chromera_velia_CCMP2878 / gene_product=hypothetical protein / transcript_product=hypothetical protein / location=Cvel_scaffold626:55408-62425(+) / protein_length=1778 / sequence_SO=supercontig / SO=protein_coding / is_pseudo=false
MHSIMNMSSSSSSSSSSLLIRAPRGKEIKHERRSYQNSHTFSSSSSSAPSTHTTTTSQAPLPRAHHRHPAAGHPEDPAEGRRASPSLHPSSSSTCIPTQTQNPHLLAPVSSSSSSSHLNESIRPHPQQERRSQKERERHRQTIEDPSPTPVAAAPHHTQRSAQERDPRLVSARPPLTSVAVQQGERQRPTQRDRPDSTAVSRSVSVSSQDKTNQDLPRSSAPLPAPSLPPAASSTAHPYHPPPSVEIPSVHVSAPAPLPPSRPTTSQDGDRVSSSSSSLLIALEAGGVRRGGRGSCSSGASDPLSSLSSSSVSGGARASLSSSAHPPQGGGPTDGDRDGNGRGRRIRGQTSQPHCPHFRAGERDGDREGGSSSELAEGGAEHRGRVRRRDSFESSVSVGREEEQGEGQNYQQGHEWRDMVTGATFVPVDTTAGGINGQINPAAAPSSSAPGSFPLPEPGVWDQDPGGPRHPSSSSGAEGPQTMAREGAHARGAEGDPLRESRDSTLTQSSVDPHDFFSVGSAGTHSNPALPAQPQREGTAQRLFVPFRERLASVHRQHAHQPRQQHVEEGGGEETEAEAGGDRNLGGQLSKPVEMHSRRFCESVRAHAPSSALLCVHPPDPPGHLSHPPFSATQRDRQRERGGFTGEEGRRTSNPPAAFSAAAFHSAAAGPGDPHLFADGGGPPGSSRRGVASMDDVHPWQQNYGGAQHPHQLNAHAAAGREGMQMPPPTGRVPSEHGGRMERGTGSRSAVSTAGFGLPISPPLAPLHPGCVSATPNQMLDTPRQPVWGAGGVDLDDTPDVRGEYEIRSGMQKRSRISLELLSWGDLRGADSTLPLPKKRAVDRGDETMGGLDVDPATAEKREKEGGMSREKLAARLQSCLGWHVDEVLQSMNIEQSKHRRHAGTFLPPHVRPSFRNKVFRWYGEMFDCLHLTDDIFFHSTSLLDRVLLLPDPSRVPVESAHELELVAIAVVVTVLKVHDTNMSALDNFQGSMSKFLQHIGNNRFPADTVYAEECRVLNALDFKVVLYPTAFDFLPSLAYRAASLPNGTLHKSPIWLLAVYLTKLSVFDLSLLSVPPAVIAVGALLLSTVTFEYNAERQRGEEPAVNQRLQKRLLALLEDFAHLVSPIDSFHAAARLLALWEVCSPPLPQRSSTTHAPAPALSPPARDSSAMPISPEMGTQGRGGTEATPMSICPSTNRRSTRMTTPHTGYANPHLGGGHGERGMAVAVSAVRRAFPLLAVHQPSTFTSPPSPDLKNHTQAITAKYSAEASGQVALFERPACEKIAAELLFAVATANTKTSSKFQRVRDGNTGWGADGRMTALVDAIVGPVGPGGQRGWVGGPGLLSATPAPPTRRSVVPMSDVTPLAGGFAALDFCDGGGGQGQQQGGTPRGMGGGRGKRPAASLASEGYTEMMPSSMHQHPDRHEGPLHQQTADGCRGPGPASLSAPHVPPSQHHPHCGVPHSSQLQVGMPLQHQHAHIEYQDGSEGAEQQAPPQDFQMGMGMQYQNQIEFENRAGGGAGGHHHQQQYEEEDAFTREARIAFETHQRLMLETFAHPPPPENPPLPLHQPQPPSIAPMQQQQNFLSIPIAPPPGLHYHQPNSQFHMQHQGDLQMYPDTHHETAGGDGSFSQERAHPMEGEGDGMGVHPSSSSSSLLREGGQMVSMVVQQQQQHQGAFPVSVSFPGHLQRQHHHAEGSQSQNPHLITLQTHHVQMPQQQQQPSQQQQGQSRARLPGVTQEEPSVAAGGGGGGSVHSSLSFQHSHSQFTHVQQRGGGRG